MNKAGQNKTIALVDWHWRGHHPTYINHFALALEDLGMDVLVLCPSPAEAAATADQTRLQTQTSRSARGRAEFQKVRVADRRFRQIPPARLSYIDWTIRNLRGIEDQAQEWARASSRKVDAIFYACIYDWDFEWISYAHSFLRMPWLGLYLQAQSYRMPGRPHPDSGRVPRPEKMFRGRLCKGISILDEGIVDQVSKSLNKPVVALPDLTDERSAVNGKEPLLVSRLRQFSAGRPIVGLFGHLKKSKGVVALLDAARMSEPAEVCFALAGEMNWPSETSESSRMHRTLAECTNVWSHLARIPDETNMNGLMALCDVIYAAYLDFPHSSNIQTKAAVLKKPLIVSDGYLMAERTRRFQLGEIIPQGDVQALHEAIIKITKDPAAWRATNNPRWSDYCQEHSFERLKSSLSRLLERV